MRRLTAALLILVLAVSLSGCGGSALTVRYAFTGREAAVPGCGEGTLTLIPGKDGAQTGFYQLCFGDEVGDLPGYEPIAQAPITGETVTVALPQGMLLPAGATCIRVYEGDDGVGVSAEPAAVWQLPKGKRLPVGESYLRFGSVSDVHVNYTELGAAAKWTAALNFYAVKEADLVVVSGDMTGAGAADEFETYVTASRAADYPFANIHEARGNHETRNNGNFLTYTAGSDEVRPAPDTPYFSLLCKGGEGHRDNLFLFMAQELSATAATAMQDNFSTEQLDWLEGMLKTYSGTETNLFIVQHAVMRDFGPGDRVNGSYTQPMLFFDRYTGNLRFKSLLTEYKEAILLNGHTHLSFYELENFSDENGCAARMIHNSSISQPRTYLPDGSISYNAGGANTETYGSEGYLVEVYDDSVIFLGYNLSTGMVIPRASFRLPVLTERRSDAVSVQVTRQPDKTVYRSLEHFDPAGLEVTAADRDGRQAPVNGWWFEPSGGLQPGTTEVLLHYGSLPPVSVPIRVE